MVREEESVREREKDNQGVEKCKLFIRVEPIARRLRLFMFVSWSPNASDEEEEEERRRRENIA